MILKCLGVYGVATIFHINNDKSPYHLIVFDGNLASKICELYNTRQDKELKILLKNKLLQKNNQLIRKDACNCIKTTNPLG